MDTNRTHIAPLKFHGAPYQSAIGQPLVANIHVGVRVNVYGRHGVPALLLVLLYPAVDTLAQKAVILIALVALNKDPVEGKQLYYKAQGQ